MMYIRASAHKKLADDITKFIMSTEKASAKRSTTQQ
jgi:hypothetical protein